MVKNISLLTRNYVFNCVSLSIINNFKLPSTENNLNFFLTKCKSLTHVFFSVTWLFNLNHVKHMQSYLLKILHDNVY